MSDKSQSFLFVIFPMHAPTLFVVPDRSFGQVNLSSLSDQAIMEALVETFSAEAQASFKDSRGEYKDVCKWNGIICNGRRRVQEIRWKYFVPGQSFGPHARPKLTLPPTLKHFHMESRTRQVMSTVVETSELPRTITFFFFQRHFLYGTIDFRSLPPDIIVCSLSFNRFIGSAILTSLPKTLTRFSISNNDFSGSLFLHNLPPKLGTLELDKNQFNGSINLSCLPASLYLVDLHENRLSGSVYLDSLPPNLRWLRLHKNAFSGSLEMRTPPPSICEFEFQDNNFSGDAVIAEIAIGFVNLENNPITYVRDEEGNVRSWVDLDNLQE